MFFAGRALIDRAVLQANQHHHLDATVGPWITDEPIAWEVGDENPLPYVADETG